MTPPAAHERPIDDRRRQVVAGYPDLWKRLTSDWRADSPVDAAWLLYSANYLLRTQRVRWAIDPLRLRWRVPEAPTVAIERDLADLSFVVLTHHHADHLDLSLVRCLNRSPILWIVPENLRTRLAAEAGLCRDRMEVPRAGETLHIGPVRLAFFSGLHDERPWRSANGSLAGRRRAIPSLALMAEFGGKRWLFPGDTRTYAPGRIPRQESIDGVFAHLWLGSGGALDPVPPLRDAFCRFFLAQGPRRVVLTHLEEFGRRAGDFWGMTQADGACQRLRELDSQVQIEIARMGDCVLL